MTWILPLVALGAALSFLGGAINKIVFPSDESKAKASGWRKAWYLTLPLHAPALAAAIGAAATTIPCPESFGDGAAGRALYFGLGGIFSPTLYNLARGFLKSAAEKAGES